MTENELAKIVFHLALKIHKTLGPGLLEKTYEECLNYELNKIGLTFERQKAMPLVYETEKLEAGYRVDFLIENKLIVEIKTVQNIDDVHISQTNLPEIITLQVGPPYQFQRCITKKWCTQINTGPANK